MFWDGWIAVEGTRVIYPAFSVDFGFGRDGHRLLENTYTVALFYRELKLKLEWGYIKQLDDTYTNIRYRGWFQEPKFGAQSTKFGIFFIYGTEEITITLRFGKINLAEFFEVLTSVNTELEVCRCRSAAAKAGKTGQISD